MLKLRRKRVATLTRKRYAQKCPCFAGLGV